MAIVLGMTAPVIVLILLLVAPRVSVLAWLDRRSKDKRTAALARQAERHDETLGRVVARLETTQQFPRVDDTAVIFPAPIAGGSGSSPDATRPAGSRPAAPRPTRLTPRPEPGPVGRRDPGLDESTGRDAPSVPFSESAPVPISSTGRSRRGRHRFPSTAAR